MVSTYRLNRFTDDGLSSVEQENIGGILMMRCRCSIHNIRGVSVGLRASFPWLQIIAEVLLEIDLIRSRRNFSIAGLGYDARVVLNARQPWRTDVCCLVIIQCRRDNDQILSHTHCIHEPERYIVGCESKKCASNPISSPASSDCDSKL